MHVARSGLWRGQSWAGVGGYRNRKSERKETGVDRLRQTSVTCRSLSVGQWRPCCDKLEEGRFRPSAPSCGNNIEKVHHLSLLQLRAVVSFYLSLDLYLFLSPRDGLRHKESSLVVIELACPTTSRVLAEKSIFEPSARRRHRRLEHAPQLPHRPFEEPSFFPLFLPNTPTTT